MKAYRITIRTLTQAISFIAIGRSLDEVSNAAYDRFDCPVGVSVRPV